MKWLLSAGVIAFVIVLIYLLKSINNIKKMPIVFKDRSVVNAVCIGSEAEKYSAILNENDLKCTVANELSSDNGYTHFLFVGNDEENLNNIASAKPECEKYVICNESQNADKYLELGAKLIDTKRPEEVVYQIIAGLKDNNESNQ